MTKAKKWTPIFDVDAACADISVLWSSTREARLVVLMHFSRVEGGNDKDLEIIFPSPLAMQWEDESFGIIDTPQTLPKCSNSKFISWTHPTLIIEGSLWAEKYAARRYPEGDPASKNVFHYFLVSMNDLVHVLADSNPSARWVAPTNA